jgi:hypothetical protein
MRASYLPCLIATLVFAFAGCAKPDAPKVGMKGGGHEHAHPDEGPHHGALIELGNEEYHGEFTVDHGKKEAVVYILDSTAKKAPKDDPATITNVTLTISNVTPPATIQLKHDPGRSGAEGIAFAGTHDALKEEKEYKGTFSVKIGAKEFTGDFEEKPHEHGKK